MTQVTRGVELKYIMESFIDKYNIEKQNHKLVPIVLAMRYKIFDSKICHDRITHQALSSPATLHI